MDNRAIKITPANPAPFAVQDKVGAKQRPDGLKTSFKSHIPKTPKEPVVLPSDDGDGMFTHAPVSLWEEDFSEVRKRFDQLKANGVEDLRKHFKKHPEEVLSLARMVRIVRVNNKTLALYDAAGPVEFREGLSPIFNKDSFEVFRDELMAFWKGRPSFTSEAVNVTLTGTSKNILIHAIIPPGFEQTWARVYVAITDITAIKDSMRGLAASEQKYRSLFETLQTAIVIADMPSGMIVEANKSAKRLFGASNGELVSLHLADLVPREDQYKIRAFLRHQAEGPGPASWVLHVHHKGNGTIPVRATTSTIEINDASVVVVSFTPADEGLPARPSSRRARDHHTGLGKKITQREREILRLICSGKTSRAIANQLCISDKTVETHRARIMQKLDTHCVVDLVKFAMANGLAQVQ